MVIYKYCRIIGFLFILFLLPVCQLSAADTLPDTGTDTSVTDTFIGEMAMKHIDAILEKNRTEQVKKVADIKKEMDNLEDLGKLVIQVQGFLDPMVWAVDEISFGFWEGIDGIISKVNGPSFQPGVPADRDYTPVTPKSTQASCGGYLEPCCQDRVCGYGRCSDSGFCVRSDTLSDTEIISPTEVVSYEDIYKKGIQTEAAVAGSSPPAQSTGHPDVAITSLSPTRISMNCNKSKYIILRLI